MFELDFAYSALLIVCLIAACSFEFVNGFHDTANAVATVIYTNSLKPWVAVIWSGFCNFIGVFWGGIAVAVGIINLLPVETLVDQNIAHSISMVMALLLTAIFWNLLTWYLGIPCSSSHTLIGSILGVGLAYSLLPEAAGDAVNWGKAQEIGVSLLISPLFGFSMTIILMYLIRTLTKKTSYGDSLFKEPKKNQAPPLWIRSILVLTCTLVSFFHGSNDGQKGVGLIMLILIGVVPTYFALNESFTPTNLPAALTKIEHVISSIDSSHLSKSDRNKLAEATLINTRLQQRFANLHDVQDIPKAERFLVRKDIMIMDRELGSLAKKEDVKLSEAEKKSLKDELKNVRKITDYSPTWVLLMISLSLGLGTMIGWKRIVKTVGEKIGKEHLTYAQGASAEIVAASTIGMSSYLGLPVSTTHVLSSGIAGSMVANRGVKNLQPDTVRNILIAWFLTLPVVMIMAGTLFLLFRAIF
ncbi:inorganic phosphate transporter [Chryseolinea lacunae]|uniref:Phosphate transporter n=1 Tax=Chryseolinea lacunae TaxID=2801331 RepID=A0ABS1KK19_9BACT|nr:inorganic phosphate transporter [Chryseolinea lacunae]MBL0739700.1 inorganic phosphate transporter [Chryseolinea lacunae]